MGSPFVFSSVSALQRMCSQQSPASPSNGFSPDDSKSSSSPKLSPSLSLSRSGSLQGSSANRRSGVVARESSEGGSGRHTSSNGISPFSNRTDDGDENILNNTTRATANSPHRIPTSTQVLLSREDLRLSNDTRQMNGHGPRPDQDSLGVASAIPNGRSPLTRERPHRRSTISQLPSFLVSAPAKLIVFGEHAVVHKKASIAAALSLRSYLLVTPLPKHIRTITLKFPDINIDHTWNIDSLPWDKFQAPEKRHLFWEAVNSLDPDLEKALEPSLRAFDEKTSKAAKAFLYLYLSLATPHLDGAIYSLRSTIPIGAGLGSSASVSVCLSTAIQLQTQTLTTPFNGMKTHETQLQLKRINNWAFVGEMCIHNFPSGVDNTVATGGKAVFFKRPNYQKPPDVKFLRNFPELPLLLINTNQSRATSVLVKNVTKLVETYEEIGEHLLEAINKVTEEANTILTAEDFDPTHASDPSLRRLGELIRINHGLLVSLGVSHPKLEQIRALTDQYDVGWTKLTGAGGGGCSFTLLKPNVKKATLEKLDAELAAAGFSKYETTLGGHGVGVMWPAVTTLEGREVEVTPELHLGAEGFAGVEALVGTAQNGESWRFWSEWDPDVLNPLS